MAADAQQQFNAHDLHCRRGGCLPIPWLMCSVMLSATEACRLVHQMIRSAPALTRLDELRFMICLSPQKLETDDNAIISR
jgi:hypothetical protein